MSETISQEDLDRLTGPVISRGDITSLQQKMLPAEELEQRRERDEKLRGEGVHADRPDRTQKARTLLPYSYDFKHPARLNKDQMRILQSIHDSLSCLWSATWSAFSRTIVDVDIKFVDQTTYAEFIASLSYPASTYTFKLGPQGLYDGHVVMDISMPLAFAYIDRVFGGRGEPGIEEPRQLSQVEMGVLAKILKQMIWDVEAMWEPIVEANIHDIELETAPEFIGVAAPSDIVLLIAFEFNSAAFRGFGASVCYPFFTIEPILPLLRQSRVAQTGPLSADQVMVNNRLRLAAMELPTVAELGRTHIGVDEAENLKTGDVIRLDARTSDPAVLFVGGKPKYLARPFAEENGELKLEVAGKIPAHLQANTEQSSLGAINGRG